MEPRTDAKIASSYTPEWPPHQEVVSVSGTIRLTNDTDDTITIKKDQHLCQIRPIVPTSGGTTTCSLSQLDKKQMTTSKSLNYAQSTDCSSIDPDNMLSPSEKNLFRSLHTKYSEVFNPSIPLYKGQSGNIKAKVNIGPTLPPQRKGRLPQYNKETLQLLQSKFDQLEAEGVFAKPEDLDINVEYLNLCFLVKKPSGGHRLVTSFGEIARYCKPQPSLMPNVDGVLRDIAKWRYYCIRSASCILPDSTF